MSMDETSFDRDRSISRISSMSVPILSHLYLIIRTDETNTYDHWLKELSNFVSIVQQLSNIKSGKFKESLYYNLLIGNLLKANENAIDVIKKKALEEGVPLVNSSDDEAFNLILEMIKVISKDLTNKRINFSKDYFKSLFKSFIPNIKFKEE